MEEENEFGIEIVKRMKKKTEEFTSRYKLNFVLVGISDRYISERFMGIDRAIFGRIKQITDKQYYTNSFMLDKKATDEEIIKAETPYHELTDGGHFTYIKQDIENIISIIYEDNVGCLRNKCDIDL